MNRIGILVVDDHPLFRRGIRMSLEGERDLLVVAEAADGPTAIHAADQFAPDVVLLDISLPTMSGFDVARAVKRRHPRTAVVIITMHEDDGHLFAAIRCGADAFADKVIEIDELVRLIRYVVAPEAEAATPSFLSARLLDEVRSTTRRDAFEPAGDRDPRFRFAGPEQQGDLQHPVHLGPNGQEQHHLDLAEVAGQ
jgi:DNA-binding NarL/FixJ family response regulator